MIKPKKKVFQALRDRKIGNPTGLYYLLNNLKAGRTLMVDRLRGLKAGRPMIVVRLR